MDSSAGEKGRPGRTYHSNEVSPDSTRDGDVRGSVGKPPSKRARRKLETGKRSEETDDKDGFDWGAGGASSTRQYNEGDRDRPGENKATMAQLLSESVIELLHVCTLVQMELNNTNGNAAEELSRTNNESSDSACPSYSSLEPSSPPLPSPSSRARTGSTRSSRER